MDGNINPINLHFLLITGAGTGLLSILAARAGAGHVYAVEHHHALAEIARQAARDNGCAEKITVLAMRSREVTLGHLSRHQPNAQHGPRCDLVISELLDFSLLGEGILPVLADARRLLAPDATAVPHAGRLFGQLIESPTAQQMRLGLSLQDDGADGPTSGSDDDGSSSDFGPGRVLGLHAKSLCGDSQTRALCSPECLRSVNFTPTAVTHEVQRWQQDHAIAMTADGTVHALLLWWELDLLPGEEAADTELRASEPASSILQPWTSAWYSVDRTISTHPQVGQFQDHWPQGLWVFGQAAAIHAGQSCRLSARCEDGVNVTFSQVDGDFQPEALVSLAESIAPAHSLAQRLCTLNDTSANLQLRQRLRSLIQSATDHVLDISHGNRCTLALLKDAVFQPHQAGTPQRITSLVSRAAGRPLVSSQLTALKNAAARIAGETSNVLPEIILWAGAAQDEGWQPEWPAVDVIVGEFWAHNMATCPLWEALSFWHLASALRPVAQPAVRIYPSGMEIGACLVSAPQLARSHAAVQAPAGVNQDAWNRAWQAAEVPDLWLDLTQYAWKALTAAAIVARLDFATKPWQADMPPLQTETALPLLPHVQRKNESIDALVLWVQPAMQAEGQKKAAGDVCWQPKPLQRQMVRWCSIKPDACNESVTLRFSLDLSTGAVLADLKADSQVVVTRPALWPQDR